MEKWSTLTILSDENIPLVQAACSSLGTVRTCAGHAITPEKVRDVDVLLVRSVTPVDADLLEGSSVRFVGSATIGVDHVDLAYLRRREIAFAHAPGSNAESVVEYVLAALLRLAVRYSRALQDMTAGVIGCGNVGGELAERLLALGLTVLRNDPPLASQSSEPHAYVSLDHLLEAADIISLHVPLTKSGPHPTYHLVDEAFLHRLSPDAWLLNTARGAVVDNAALRQHLEAGGPAAAVLDVWEGEPRPDIELIGLVDLATPHIAGYSYDGKVQGALMLYQALTRYLGVEEPWTLDHALAEEDQVELTPPPAPATRAEWLDALVQQMYAIEADDARMRRLVELPPDEQGEHFIQLRKHYPRRRTFRRFQIEKAAVPRDLQRAVTDGLRVRLV